jgi:hypothetical protein
VGKLHVRELVVEQEQPPSQGASAQPVVNIEEREIASSGCTCSEEERSGMSPQSRLVAGIVLIIVPTVAIGGASILSLLIADPTYAQNDLRQDLWRAGHAHAGVWLVLSLVALRYVDEATLSDGMRWVVRVVFPIAAVLMALGFFMSVLSPDATEPNAMIYLTYVAGLLLAVGLLVLGIGLIRGRRTVLGIGLIRGRRTVSGPA